MSSAEQQFLSMVNQMTELEERMRQQKQVLGHVDEDILDAYTRLEMEFGIFMGYHPHYSDREEYKALEAYTR